MGGSAIAMGGKAHLRRKKSTNYDFGSKIVSGSKGSQRKQTWAKRDNLTNNLEEKHLRKIIHQSTSRRGGEGV